MGLAIIVPDVDFSDANLGQITLMGNVPVRSININLDSSYTGVEVELKASLFPINTTQRNVIWSIVSGNEYATISGNILTIDQSADADQVIVRCTSSDNNSVYSEKTITVTYNGTANPLVIYEGRSIITDGEAYLDVLTNFTGEKRFNCTASEWEVDFYAPATSSNVRALFGASAGGVNEDGFTAMIRNTSESNAFQFETISSLTSGIGNRILAKNTNGSITLIVNNAIVKTFSVNINTCVTNYLYLGCRSNQGNAELFASGIQIYSFKLSTLASGEICDLVPCTYNGIVGMYNKTNQEVLLPTNGAFTLV